MPYIRTEPLYWGIPTTLALTCPPFAYRPLPNNGGGANATGWPGSKAPDASAPAGFGQDEFLGLTAREKLYGQRRLRDDHYASRFKWAAGQPAPKLPEAVEEAGETANEVYGEAAKVNGSSGGSRASTRSKRKKVE